MESSGGNLGGGGLGGDLRASLGGRYAVALFDLAREEGRLDVVAASLATLKQALRGSDDLQSLTGNPLMSRKDAGRGIAAVAQALELDATTAKFLGVLAANRRLNRLPAILRAFERLAARHRGETTAEVISAHPLTDAQLGDLKDRLRMQTKSDVTIDHQVDPAILGGLIVRLGSRQIDGSIRTKLNTLAHAMKG